MEVPALDWVAHRVLSLNAAVQRVTEEMYAKKVSDSGMNKDKLTRAGF